MDSEATRISLAEQGAKLEQIAKNVERLVDLSEKLARMQERETDRDDRIKRLFKIADEADDAHAELKTRVTASTYWARGVLAVIVAIILPVAGAVLYEALHELPALDRRVQALEITQRVMK